MSLTLSQLITPLTVSQWETALFAALQGLGFVEHRGTGTGGVVLSGAPSAPYDVLITIVGAGELGTGSFQCQTIDQFGTVTTSDVALIPSDGIYAVPGTGVTATFIAGPANSGGNSFDYLDTFGFSLTTPVFPVTAWEAGGVARTLINLWAQGLADGDRMVATLAGAGLAKYAGSIGLASDSWADLLADNVYSLTRKPAVTTQGLATLTCSASAGPYAITAGQLTISDVSGRLFTNIGAGTLPVGGTLQLTWQAAAPGSAYNIGNNTLTTLVTSLAGVTVNNPDPGSGSWVTVRGADKETTAALMTRCLQRWNTQGGAATADGYIHWATTASPEITRANAVVDGGTEGQVDVYVAGAGGAVSSTALATAQAYIDQRTPLCVSAVVANATPVAVTVTATVYVKAAKLAAAQTTVTAALSSFFNNLPIGGERLSSGSYGVSKEEVVRCLANADGVTDVSISAPASDTVLTSAQVATLTNSVTFTAI